MISFIAGIATGFVLAILLLVAIVRIDEKDRSKPTHFYEEDVELVKRARAGG